MIQRGHELERSIMMKSKFDFSAFDIQKNERALKLDDEGRPERWQLVLKHDWDFREKHHWCRNNNNQSEKDFVVLEALDRFN